jgi:hypothetical protein
VISIIRIFFLEAMIDFTTILMNKNSY